MDTESLLGFPACGHSWLLEDSSASRVAPLGEDSWTLEPGVPQTSLHMPLLFAGFA